MLRRFLPFIFAAGLSTLLLFTIFQNISWQALPQTIGLGDSFGPSEEEIAKGDNVLPDLRTRPDATQPYSSGFKEPNVAIDSPYPVGQTKPPGSNYTRTLVISRLAQEDTTWVEQELGDLMGPDGSLNTAIYVVNNKSAPLHPPQNKGHEVMVYLTYIIDNYENLPDISIFMHAHQKAWHNLELLDTDASLMVRYLSSERVTRMGYMNLRCHWDPGCPAWLHPGQVSTNWEKQEEHLIAKSWSELFPLDPIPTVLAQPCCAQFAVSRERILALPKQRYVYLRDWIIRTELSDYLSGRMFEYTWQFIFSGSPTHCPSMSACYCDGYGLCFGTADKFDRYFELRYNRNKHREELRVWREKKDLLEQYRKHSADGKLAEEALLEVPEVGKDTELQEKISKLQDDMDAMLKAAYRLGRDPAQRAKESGREWKEGDGF